MARVLITGMSGAGKSTVLEELDRRGERTVDTDYGVWTLSDRSWDEPRMANLLATHTDVVVSGTVENQGRFYDRFEHIVLITAPFEVLLRRLASRTNNPYGKSAAEREEIRRHVEGVEPLLRRGATSVVDGRRPVTELARAIQNLMRDRCDGPATPPSSLPPCLI